MSTSPNAPAAFDIRELIAATAQNSSADVFRPALKAADWQVLGSYLQPLSVRPGQVLIQQNAADRTVYLVESGSLTVHYEDKAGRIRLASVDAGSAVGEGAFFSREPRNATVQAATACKLWTLSPLRFGELSNRQPQIALEVAMALGAIVSKRLSNRLQRVAVT
ncbi:Crp/Fnr family transcriptional regulator [Ramlibacter pallidus]|uniref:Cyclic nucleotide-binding domain-containing protein n=1 Tax=Ramlibacter pallidus TaxID=2780087 RepID=A0ABR9SAG9_9BURK|nr:cyclic nucleotide-binding domain-containing protein [Ramlibacter pallidus]MBE7370039.1 cyclic nucleotide-binding domain-containing protein [Ramlibacter pallidus]